jgi:PAS domain S-box-containing protein
VTVALDITDQKGAEDALREAEDRYDELFENAAELVYTHDLSGRMTSINAAGERLLGYTREEICDLTIGDIAAPDCRDLPIHMARFQLRNHTPVTYDMRLLTKLGDRVTVEVTTSILKDGAGVPVGVQAIARDVTHRRELCEQLRRVQALAATGMLAGTLADEYEKVIDAILGNAYLLKARVRERSAASEPLHALLEHAEAAARLNETLNRLAAKERSSGVLDLHRIIRKLDPLLSATLDPRIRVTFELDAESADITGDAAELQQMFLNLALNAAEAMPDGGELKFSTEVRANQLTVTVRDSGKTLPESVRERIFEPLLAGTTPDDSSGLALAMVGRIVQKHGGSVSVDSDGRHGTALRLSFPLQKSGVALEQLEQTYKLEGRRAGTVLIVNDEEPVRRVLARVLEELGFETTGFCLSDEAAEFYRLQGRSADVVFIDIDGTGPRALACMHELKQINPALRAVLAISPAMGEASAESKPPAFNTVAKPYTMKNLGEAMHAALTV